MESTRQLREARPANRWEAGVLVDPVRGLEMREGRCQIRHAWHRGARVGGWYRTYPREGTEWVALVAKTVELENRGCGAPPCFANLV